jgi:hypothetical protein
VNNEFNAENPLTLTLKGKDFLNIGCLPKNFSNLQGWGTEKFGLFDYP